MRKRRKNKLKEMDTSKADTKCFGRIREDVTESVGHENCKSGCKSTSQLNFLLKNIFGNKL